MRLAATEYDRFAAVISSLTAEQWTAPTECPDWDVRQLACHVLGMAAYAASIREGRRQAAQAHSRGGVYIDALTCIQVQERADYTPERIVHEYGQTAPRAARGRRWTPPFIRARQLPHPQEIDGIDEWWTIGFVTEVILTRDVWMHRVDLCRATGQLMRLTPEHDGVLVEDVVTEWAARHGKPYTLHLTGRAGGTWSTGSAGETHELDAVEFCRTISGRGTGTGLLSTFVPF
ncbi:MAG: hypothetical protein JWN03_1584 [Nocardia sp.]|nr:hypothetical protein [Nocardia sp.]